MSRAEQIATARRRRNADMGGVRSRLAVDTTKLDMENFTHRWVNDEPGRIEALTVQDDWEVVTDRANVVKDGNTGIGTEVSQYVGIGGGGSSGRAVLLRKPKTYHDEDKAAAQRRIDETENAMRQGMTPGTSPDAKQYAPQGRSIIAHGDRNPT